MSRKRKDVAKERVTVSNLCPLSGQIRERERESVQEVSRALCAGGRDRVTEYSAGAPKSERV